MHVLKERDVHLSDEAAMGLVQLQPPPSRPLLPLTACFTPASSMATRAGTPHKAPVLNSTGYVVHEATAIASGLLERGVPAQSQLKEVRQSFETGHARTQQRLQPRSCTHSAPSPSPRPLPLLCAQISSYDTVGNAYYSLTIHALPAGWSSLAVITSEFHMLRTQALFSHIYGSATPQIRAKR